MPCALIATRTGKAVTIYAEWPKQRMYNMLKTSNSSTMYIVQVIQKMMAGLAIICLISACSVSEPSKGPQVTPSEPTTPAPGPTPTPFPFPLPDFSKIKIPMPRPLVPLEITAPVNRAPSKTIPDTFELTFEGDVPENLSDITIFLNHNDVTGDMTVVGKKATATGETLKKYIKEGVNTFTAEGKHVFFVYDTQAPRPVITQVSALNGANCQLLHAVKADENSPKVRPDVTSMQQTVTGHVFDHSQTASMAISVKAQDGSEISNKVITLNDDGSFSEPLDCGYFFDIETEDALGNKNTVTYAAPGLNYEPSMAVQVNKSLFDFVLPAISDVMKSLGTSELIDSDTPIIIPNCIDTPLLKRDCKVDLRKLSFEEDPKVIFELKDDNDPNVESLVIRAGADLPVLKMDATLTLTGGSELPPVNFDIEITKMLVAISPVLSSDSQNALQLKLVDQKPVELSFDIAVKNLSLKVFGFPIDVTPLANSIATAARSALDDAVDKTIAPKLRELLEGSLPSGTMPFLVAWDNDIKAKMAIDIAPAKLNSSGGNALIELAGNVYAQELGATSKGGLGNLHLSDPLPALGAKTQSGKEYDLGIALPVNLLNQLFLSIHQTGLLQDFTLPFTFLGGLGVPFDAVVERAGIKKGDILNITIDAGSAFEVKLRKGELTDFLLYLDRFTFIVKYQSQKKEGDDTLPPEQTLIKATTDLVVNLGLGVTQDNYIGLSVDKLVSMNLIALESDFIQTNLIPLEKASAAINDSLSIALLKGDAVTGGISKVVKDTIGQVVGQVTGLTLDLALPDIGVVLREFGADDTNSHLMLAVDLLNKAEIEEAKKNGEQLTFVLFLNPQNDSNSSSEGESSTSTTQAQAGVTQSSIVARSSYTAQSIVIDPFNTEVIQIGESASIGLNGENPTPEKGPLEYRYRINGEAWSLWKPRSSIDFYKMSLGLHSLEVCARTAMLVEAKDCQAVKLSVSY